MHEHANNQRWYKTVMHWFDCMQTTLVYTCCHDDANRCVHSRAIFNAPSGSFL